MVDGLKYIHNLPPDAEEYLSATVTNSTILWIISLQQSKVFTFLGAWAADAPDYLQEIIYRDDTWKEARQCQDKGWSLKNQVY